MRVLITNIALSGRSGTETVTRDLALSLLRLGHRPVVYTPLLGPLAEELHRSSISVVDDVSSLDQEFDVIHGHHNHVAAAAVARYPTTPALFVSHDSTAWHDVPPILPSIRRYVAVDETVADRLRDDCGVPQNLLRIIFNAVDTFRFSPGPPLPNRPARALAFAKNVGHIEAIEQACRSRGIGLDVIGAAVGRVVDAPERLLPDYDLVFASALSCIEAIACGRSVIVCDGRGLAGIVTSANVSEWRRSNFGSRLLRRAVTVDAIRDEIDRYDPYDAKLVSERIRAEADANIWVSHWIALYHEILSERAAVVSDCASFPIAMSRHLQKWGPRADAAWPWMEERKHLIVARDKAMLGSVVTLDQTIFFHRAALTRMLIYGFSEPEDWGVWTDDEEACWLGALVEPPHHDISLDLSIRPFVHDRHRRIDVAIIGNGQVLGEWAFKHRRTTGMQTEQVSMTVPMSVFKGRRYLSVTFRIRSPASPQEAGISADARRLGLGLLSAVLRPADRLA
jgi:hypothetical protein